MNHLNFNSIQKRYLTITLNDEKQTTILVGTPSKKVLNELMKIQGDLKGDFNETEQFDGLFKLCANIMSRNKGGIKISKDILEEIFDIEDIMVFLQKYMEFVEGQIQGKN